MIKSLTSSSPSIYITSSSSPYISPGSAGAGIIRYNPNSQQLEVNDGSSWLTLSSFQSISLSADAEQALDWAKKKLKQEQELDALATQHPGIKDLQEKLEIMVALVKQQEQNDSR